ncbi:hypothetical protein DERP_011404 [Dermatophagoides pteronyssinus]|uniref:Uncharacterized protein n=1 Tax=Dermatophagoides pteronyssinus TaxID=6956 RepID=A0ABQ8J595_DERPT|nr:hypothetical protein DERP_011404 [Dermatophagoides pteronyssinus]
MIINRPEDKDVLPLLSSSSYHMTSVYLAYNYDVYMKDNKDVVCLLYGEIFSFCPMIEFFIGPQRSWSDISGGSDGGI